MVAAKKEVTYHVFDRKSSVGFIHPKIKKFIITNENNELTVSEGGEEVIETLERAVDISEA